MMINHGCEKVVRIFFNTNVDPANKECIFLTPTYDRETRNITSNMK